MKEKIDFVITWVDGNDPKWKLEKSQILGEKVDPNNINNVRYRDWDNLKYIFRGIEKYASWVNKVYFVTWGHFPEWLNTENEKLVIVNHKDYIPSQYLPTYSSHVLELNLHRIKGLSDKFVYFNDDTFILNYVKPEDFFKNGKPVDYAILTSIIPEANSFFSHILLNNTSIINKNFQFNRVVKKNWHLWFNLKYKIEQFRTLLLLPWKTFTGFKYSHLPSAFLKSTFEEVWNKEYAILDETCHHKTRTIADVNQYLIKQWQLVSGNFSPMDVKAGKFYNITNDNTKAIQEIKKQKYKMYCLNDSEDISDFEKVKTEINKTLDEILPNKSNFEL